MPSVHCLHTSISFGVKKILDDINFSISIGDRIALSGANGSGKTTLMRIISGEIKPDSGEVVHEKNTRVSYLPQVGVTFPDITIWEGAEKAFDEMKPVFTEMKELEEKLESCKKETPETGLILERYHYLHETIIESEYYTRNGTIHRVLTGLGFKEKDFEQPIASFSSGWQMRIALAKVLLEKPDIMLLDEPTNYLDLEARNWLEDFLLSFKGGICIVSHDRFFLDVTVNRIAEIYQRKVSFYQGNYSEYENKRSKEMEKAIDTYTRQQEEIAKTELFIKRFRYNSSKAKLVQSRILYLEKLDRLEKPPGVQRIHFSFAQPKRSGDIVLEVRDVNKSYGTVQALNRINFTLARGERLSLVGPNGAGKSTLMRILSKQESPDNGTVHYGSNVSTGFFSQDQGEETSKSISIIEELESIAPTEMIPHLRHLLGAFLFTGDDIYKSLSVLSGGERSRVLLLKLLLNPANLLLLDEPTNHLDIESKNILLDALKEYTATIIFVSHDRYFIQHLATKVLELEQGRPRLYYGDYDYYLYRKKQMQGSEEQGNPEKIEGKKKEIKKNTKTHEEEKKRKNRLKKLKEDEDEITRQLDELHTSVKKLEMLLVDEDVYRDGGKVKEVKTRIEEKKQEHDVLFARWEEIEKEITLLESG
ncbi:MAG: ABC-F family ATP-binding cassette domain-containing protein [Spirochaetales bacterium]|nr:ABC-F family ATP-binding cassette domain-containing protein [Spirochaetales bacterium]